jgi:glycine/sarcosine N-methyltransferase
MINDEYRDFADRYDLFYKEFGKHSIKVKNFYKKTFNENQFKSVLDCACGTGHDLILFESLGCKVVGSDISESMLEIAKQNLIKYGLSMPLVQLDYRDLHQNFFKKFDAVMCLSSSIFHMPDDREVLKAFNSMYQVLREGGILILTQGTTDKQWKEKPRFILAVSGKEFSRLFVIDYINKGAIYNVLDIFHSKSKSEFKVWSVNYPNILLKDDYKRLLRESGFKKINFYGNYNFEKYNKKTSDILIIIAYK